MLECNTKKWKNLLLKAGYGASGGDLVFVQELLKRRTLLLFGESEYGVTDILYVAAGSKSCDLFRVLLDFAITAMFLIMNRVIYVAARAGNLKVLKELITDCCDDILAYRDIQGVTPLHAAAGEYVGYFAGTNILMEYVLSNVVVSRSFTEYLSCAFGRNDPNPWRVHVHGLMQGYNSNGIHQQAH
ncbi:hypothetical protein CQW23_14394 [Capsicum baccatum]|uniref:Uncharacterized protein n=1 Tax=Capsicum baccatum TaxID=33114 RepID=A0A2G2WJ16_CAPBA|nr:hypothetical protein CQW23_14394 [Capsicum baccatum]